MVRLPEGVAERAALFQSLLGEGRMLLVMFDAGIAGVRAPPNLRGATVFSYAMNLPMPMSNLRVDPEGIAATLWFSGKRNGTFDTFVPWSAVRAMRCADASAENSRNLRSHSRRAGVLAGASLVGALTLFPVAVISELPGIKIAFGFVAALFALHAVGSAVRALRLRARGSR